VKNLQALQNEIDRFMVIDEDKQEPIRNFEEKFLKALKFEITEKCGRPHKKNKQATQIPKRSKDASKER